MPSITLDIYGHLIPGIQEEAAQMIDELITLVFVVALPAGHHTNFPFSPPHALRLSCQSRRDLSARKGSWFFLSHCLNALQAFSNQPAG